MKPPFREQFDLSENPQGAAFSIGLGPVYNVYQPAYLVGEIVYADTTGTLARLAPNTTTTRKFARMTGTGSAGQAPVWDTILAADIPGSALTRVDDTNVTLTLGGTPSAALLAATSLTLGWSGTLSLARGGTGAALVDPNADRILFWDDSAGAVTFLEASTGLNITTTALTVTWATPGAIGSGTPNTGAFTSLTATTTIAATGQMFAGTAISISRSAAPTIFQTDRTDTHGDAATISQIDAYGRDSGAAQQQYSSIITKATLDNAAAEEGELEFHVVTGGAVTEVLSLTGSAVTVGAGSSNGIIRGTDTNDSAAAGFVGEIIETTVLTASAVSLVTTTAKTIASVSLTAGDWNVWGNVSFNGANTTTVQAVAAYINTVDNTAPTAPGAGAYVAFPLTFTSGTGDPDATVPAGMRRISVSGTTTVYLIGLCVFGTSTMAAYGYIGARRVR